MLRRAPFQSGLDFIECRLNYSSAMSTKHPKPKPPTELPASRPSRGRPPTITSERLLDVARDVFLECGIRATTQDVAERAGVSEGVLFHRFKSKDIPMI